MYFIGEDDSYMMGVPMRDMTQAEWSALPEDVRKALLAAKLFSGKKPEDRQDEPVVAEKVPASEPAKGG